MGLAIDVLTGLLLRVDGTSYPQIYAVRPLRSDEAFESTAIPEIRRRCSALANKRASRKLEMWRVFTLVASGDVKGGEFWHYRK